MTRFALVVVGLAIAGATGCAQCDTCDDFPAPCVGPNCGQNGYDTNGFVPPTQDGLPYEAARMAPPADDTAPPMNNGATTPSNATPDMPSPSTPPTAAPDETTPPAPGA